MDNEDERTAPRNNALSDLHYRRERLLERRGRAQKFYYTLVSVSLLFIAVGPVLAWKVYSPVSIVWIYMLLYALMPLAMLPTVPAALLAKSPTVLAVLSAISPTFWPTWPTTSPAPLAISPTFCPAWPATSPTLSLA